MDIIQHRVANGVLKAMPLQFTPETLRDRLAVDVEIVVDPARAGLDLWPALWATAAAVARQFSGRVYLRSGLAAAMPAPRPLSARCQWIDRPSNAPVVIGIGVDPCPPHNVSCFGDARAGIIHYDELGKAAAPPCAIECFILAGYLSFAALALAVGLPPYRADFAQRLLRVDYDATLLNGMAVNGNGFTLIGAGQLGQAYLALLYFLREGDFAGMPFAVVDFDRFEEANASTQVLLGDEPDWVGERKAEYVASLLTRWGASAVAEIRRLEGGWKRPEVFPRRALSGVDNFEARRLLMGAGFDRVYDAGLGGNLAAPSLTWHVLPGDPALGRMLFPDNPVPALEVPPAPWAAAIVDSPGRCGWLRFSGVTASAPSLGLAAAGFLLAEISSAISSARRGRALLWSSLIPIDRQPIAYGKCQTVLVD
ncbi:MAG: hypothetical protein ABL989_11830 [Gammaproteobacteria bacterium]